MTSSTRDREDFAINWGAWRADRTRTPASGALSRCDRRAPRPLPRPRGKRERPRHPTRGRPIFRKSRRRPCWTASCAGVAQQGDAELFRAQMLTEMALMACDDGMVMQLHAGSWRNHNPWLLRRFGPSKGADIPTRTDYVGALKPLLDRVGACAGFTLILFTLDESAYARELAPLAGHYPCLRLGAPWWFHDSPEGMLRFRRQTTETAGFYNTAASPTTLVPSCRFPPATTSRGGSTAATLPSGRHGPAR